jgi:hypothetical protein
VLDAVSELEEGQGFQGQKRNSADVRDAILQGREKGVSVIDGIAWKKVALHRSGERVNVCRILKPGRIWHGQMP